MDGARGQVRRSGSVRLLDHDPTMGEGIEERDLGHARRYAVAETLTVARGELDPTELERPGMLGLLGLGGYLLRSIEIGGRRCAILIGPGTFLRPWASEGRFAVLPSAATWRVLSPFRVALIDRRTAAAAMRWSPLMAALVARTAELNQLLSMVAAIYSLQHIDLRLLSMMWLYAGGYGVATPEGTVLPVALSHRDLAELVAGQRPSVSAALTDLSRRGLVVRRPDRTWLLRGDCPREISDLRVRTHELRPAVDGPVPGPDRVVR